MLSLIRNNFGIFICAAEDAVDPMYDAITTIGPYAIGVVALLGMVYALIIGVRMAKADNANDVAAARSQLISAIIGVVVIVVLLSVLYAIREPLISWANNG